MDSIKTVLAEHADRTLEQIGAFALVFEAENDEGFVVQHVIWSDISFSASRRFFAAPQVLWDRERSARQPHLISPMECSRRTCRRTLLEVLSRDVSSLTAKPSMAVAAEP